ncbi:pyrroline-5-carboxylate reductase family protein, partial [Corynebacterium stationis]
MTKIAVIGGGQIGEALTGGLIASGFDGQDIVVTNRQAERREEFEETYKVKTTDNNQEAVKGADVV